MHSLPSRLHVVLIAGALAVAASCAHERAEQRHTANVVPTQFWPVIAIVEGRLWVGSNAGVVAIDPVSETWTIVDLGGEHLVPTSLVSCGSDVWLRQGDTLGLYDLKTRKVRILATAGLRWPSALVKCGQGDLWVYDQTAGTLFKFPVGGGSPERHTLSASGGRSRYFTHAEFLTPAVYLLAPGYGAHPDSTTGLFRFDPSTSNLSRLDLPGNAPPRLLARVEHGLLVHTRDSKTFVLKADGKPWEETTNAFYGDSLLAQGDSVVWVGASYDVSPASYFVVRYIRDAREPKDLLVLPRFEGAPLAYSAVSFLGMLWSVSNDRLLRIDPTAEELVTYLPQDTSGRFVRRSFRLKSGAELPYLQGDTLSPFPKESPAPADGSQKPEG